MSHQSINQQLAQGDLANPTLLPHSYRLSQAEYIFEHTFGLDVLPREPGILIIRGARQYGKSTWLEQQVIATVQEFGAGSAYYINGDYVSNARELEEQLTTLSTSFAMGSAVKRIFIDEITAVNDWEKCLKRLNDSGILHNVLIVTTGSKATDLRRGAERLPGRKGKLARANYLFTPISYRSFHKACQHKLQELTLPAYLLSGGSPIACAELAAHGVIPEYVISLTRDWIEGEIAKSGRHRSALLNVMNCLFRLGGTPVGQAKLARETGLANNTVAQGYIELLNDLGCVVPAFPIDVAKQQLILRKPCKYHFMNTLVALAYYPENLRRPEDFTALPPEVRAMWLEWVVAQELQRRRALEGDPLLQPLAFWQTTLHEIDFVELPNLYLEIKNGQSTALEFAWFVRQIPHAQLTVLSKSQYRTERISGITLEEFLLEVD